VPGASITPRPTRSSNCGHVTAPTVPRHTRRKRARSPS
jgi:hypothetical protein